jgi:hypothetical protein
LLSQSLRDPGDSDLGAPEPGPADADSMLRLPGRLARRLDRAWQRVPVWARTGAPDAVTFMVFIVLGFWVSARVWKSPGKASGLIPGAQSAYESLLVHVAGAVRHLENPLAGLPPHVPGGGWLVPQAAAFGPAYLLSPVTLLFGPGVAYALWLTLGLAGTGATTYWVLSRHLVRSRVAAFIGGYVFAFAPGILWHANGQPDLVTNLLIPLIVLQAVRLGRGRPVRDGIILGVLVVGQLLINPEPLAITALAGGYALVCYQVQRDGPTPLPGVRPVLAGLAVAAGTALVLLAYPLWFRFFGDPLPHRVPVPDPRLGEDPTTLALYWRDTIAGNYNADHVIGGIEQDTWFGWPLLILAGVCIALAWARSVAVRVVTLTALAFGILALGAQIRLNGAPTPVPGPWWIFAHLPGFALITPTHLALVLVACLAVLLAVVYDVLPDGEPARYGLTVRRLSVILFAVALIPNVPKPVQASVQLKDVPKVVAAAQITSGEVPR